MKTNTKLFLAIVITAVVAYFLGWLIFSIILGNFYMSNLNIEAQFLMREEPALLSLFFAMLAWTTLLTLVLQKTDNITFKKGFVTSLWLSFLIMVMFNLNMYAFWNIYTITFLIVDIIISTIFWALIGGISGAILAWHRKVIPVQ